MILHIPSTAGELPKHWCWKRLDQLCEGIFDCPHSTPDLILNGPFIARSQDIRAGVFRMEEAGHISEETYQERVRRAEPRYGDLLYSREGTYFGIAAEVPLGVRVCLGQRMVLLRPDSQQVQHRFLRYWLNSPIMSRHIHGHRDGTVAERLNLPTIRGLSVAVPPLPEQHAIAQILGTLDDKIELNHKMNGTLEAITQVLFKSWFVDFDPVRAKAEGHYPDLPREIADLFPDSFENSELGEIPKGWEILKLAEAVDINSKSISNEYTHNLIQYIDISSVKTGKLKGTTTYILQQAPSRAQRLVTHGDTIWSCVRPNRRSYLFIHEPPDNLVVSTGFAVLTPRRVTPSYLYAWTTTDNFMDYLTCNADGSAYPAVRSDCFAAADILVPNQELLGLFERLAGEIRNKIAAIEKQSRTLATLRDTLLPKLLSGEIRVGDAERLIAETT